MRYIISMKTKILKIAMFLALFTVLSAFSFADTFFDFSLGHFIKQEQYSKEDYSRGLNGVNFIVKFMMHFLKRTIYQKKDI